MTTKYLRHTRDENGDDIKLTPEQEAIWEGMTDGGYILHMMSSTTPMTFDEIFAEAAHYHYQYPSDTTAPDRLELRSYLNILVEVGMALKIEDRRRIMI